MRRWFLSRRWLLRIAGVLLTLGLAAPQVWAWSQFQSARTALAKYHPQEARRALDSCQRVWGERASVHLLACRAAWQDGDSEEAVRQLREAQRLLGKATDETAFEWALVQAAGGNVWEVEQFLQTQADRSPEAAAVVWEALAAGYLRVYRSLDAMSCLNFWLKQSPDNVRALELRGQTYFAGKGVTFAAKDYRRVLELDPSRTATRRRLIECLLGLGGYEEATGHLEQLIRENPDDPGLAARLARCYNLLGRGEEARRLVDTALAKHPDDGLCLRTLGQIELLADRKPEAEAALRRAVARLPEDYQTHRLLAQSFQLQGKFEEAQAQLKVAETIKDRDERFGELTSRKLAEFPLDPALHYEMGSILIKTGRGEVGERWLQTALSLDPKHRPSHAALAAYYESQGDKAKADFHRTQANSDPKPE